MNKFINQPTTIIPHEILAKIMQFDGRMRYIDKNFINTIHPHDKRYAILTTLVKKKKEILKTVVFDKNDNSFYIEFTFTHQPRLGLCYAYGGWSSRAFSQKEKIEISYYNFKQNTFLRNRTYI